MLKNLLDLIGIETLSIEEQKSINDAEVLCKERGMCAQYGEHCAEMACKEIPIFEI